MRLSEAIRLGIGAVTEKRELYLDVKPGSVCGCAIGTALYALGYKDIYDIASSGVEATMTIWPWTREKYTADGETDWHYAKEISVRHYRGQSRESLAAWIEQLENERGITDGQAYTEGGEASGESICERSAIPGCVETA